MSYDESVADRLRACLDVEPDIEEKKMFGGLAFLLNGSMAVGVLGNELIIRLSREDSERALDEPGVRIFDLRDDR